MADNTKLLESIDHRLKMMLKIEVEDRLDQHDTMKEKVETLHGLGFDTQEMAEMIGTSPASIRATRSDLREQGRIDD